ncbi:cupin domain-containing protein [Streptomyces monomycini]|uniref:cupin domain-containing protein n=1 Tax=Streptomyces monomycini TaxID=371720 RepID=UPI0004AB677A|nr:cupin domain-containing protein [Streptomyces monomycini]
MIRMRIAGGLLAVATLTAVTACGNSAPAAHAHASTSASAVASEHPTDSLKPLLQQDLPNVKGKTFTSAIVDFPPNARAAPHRHGHAFTYAYVLEGSVRSKLEGKPATTYHRGDHWVEPPGTHHVLAENTSATKPAKLLIVVIANPGEALKTDDPK